MPATGGGAGQAANAAGNTPLPSGTIWSTALLMLLKAPLSPQNYQFLNQWAIREHGSDTTLYANNPFFTTAGGSGTVGDIKAGSYPLIPDSAFGPGRTNTAGVPAYPNLATGVWITAYHLASEYPAIVAALRTGNPASAANSTAFTGELKAWSGSSYTGFAGISAPAGPVGPPIGTSLEVGKIPSSVGQSILAHGTSTASSLLNHVPGVSQAEAVGSFLGKLTDPSYLLRGLQIVAGAGMVAIGVTLLARQVALAADVPSPVKAVPGVAAAAAIE